MALLKHEELAEYCGITNGNLTNYRKRGKVVWNQNNLYDTNSPFNRDFILKRTGTPFDDSKIKRKEKVKFEDKKPKKNVAKVKQAKTEVEESEINQTKTVEISTNSAKNTEEITKYNVETQLKLLEAEKKSREIELLKIKIEKLNGLVIPTDLVKLVFGQHFKSAAIAFKDGAEKFLTRFAVEKNLNRSEIAKARLDLTEIINTSIKESIENSKKDIDKVISQFVEKRGKGEKYDS